MVKYLMRSSSHALGALLAATCFGACESNAPLAPRPSGPAVFIMLPVSTASAEWPAVSAVIAKSVTASGVQFVQASRFEMRRVGDSRLFDWRSQEAPQSSPFLGIPGNYRLADTTSATGLGRDALMPGERYSLAVEFDGVLVQGQVVIPGRPNPQLRRGSTQDTVVWSPVPGAGAYLDPDGAITTDTVWISERAPTRGAYTVTAMDPNWARYKRSPTSTQEGVQGALGLFGAQVSATLTVPSR